WPGAARTLDRGLAKETVSDAPPPLAVLQEEAVPQKSARMERGLAMDGAIHPRLFVAFAVAITAVLGWLDFVTGPDFGFSLFYLVPTVATARWVGRRPALLVATVASLAWLVADLGVRPRTYSVGLSLWNGLTRAVIYLLLARLVAGLREDRAELAILNGRLNELAIRESALARTDYLTGLANSRAFLETLGRELARSRREGTHLVLASVDLDRFKAVNDRFGHAAGDELLRRTGAVLAASVRAGDLVARIGGDEFAILLPNLSASSAEAVVSRALVNLRQESRDYADSVGFGASIGLASRTAEPESAESLLHRADEAVYSAKAAGRGQIAHAP
ncbi:MAG: diguanylate cyclase, partial [Acidobacteriota bacterium]|nr:diguanylate cyclase [Acidobacteriota bacterium]